MNGLRFTGPRRRVDKVELHVTHTCNLTCESCSHYSNQGHSGNLDLAQAERWMAAWSQRLEVRDFALLGGEPTVHPDLAKFVGLVRRYWPRTRIHLTTNGFFLHRHPDLPKALAEAGDTHLWLSVHHRGETYAARLRPITDLLESWRRDYGTIVHEWPSHRNWTRRYHGFGDAMLPFEDADQRKSWEICPARHCKQLHEGRLWKCAPLAYLGMQKAKFDLSEKWDRYLRYSPLDATCTDRELDAFLAIEDEAACSMCPAQRHGFELPNPLRGGG